MFLCKYIPSATFGIIDNGKIKLDTKIDMLIKTAFLITTPREEPREIKISDVPQITHIATVLHII